MQDFGQKMDYVARLMLPAVASVILFMLIMLPVGMIGMAVFPPQICLISIYYWSIFYPSTMPSWFLFFLGIFVDSLLGTPLGVSSLVFMLFRLMIMVQQRLLAKETFLAMWVSFGVAMAGILTLQWIILGAYYGSALPIQPLAMQWMFTIGLYPLAHLGFSLLYPYLPPQPGKTMYRGRSKR